MPPPRRKVPTVAQKHELEAFAEKYDTYAEIYGDPVEVVFRIMADSSDDKEVQLRAADMLMGYRYPRVKAQEVGDKVAPVLNFNVNMQPPAKEIDVTPAPVLQIRGNK